MALEYKTRTQVVLEEIRNRILSGKIKAGEPLRQAALAEDLNVSRIPIREALLQLEAEGLVVFEPHRGATVTELSSTQVMELFELRALLETELLRLAIPKLTETALAESEHILQQMTLAYQMVDTSGSWSELNSRFHLSLYLAAERPMMFEIVQNLNKNTDRYIRLHLLLAGGVTKSDPEHLTLLTLCRQKNVEQACIWLRQHILGAASEIIELVKQQ
ncbi:MULTISPECIES: GntR family transcriptional regulator [Alkalimonas]|uniref:GntR family transcriptional regulator n=1 Tax=Alkalimonas mucilaginosa TaxID=3057676 RepID=A0ABU7JGJ7_9GAMM|nr:GntR family transcriptional regulator [Alkalimonas sp. MEB004]MEE2024757.1 GntR family transcriptional regulator [Alkalimonas sp. MEB004]